MICTELVKAKLEWKEEDNSDDWEKEKCVEECAEGKYIAEKLKVMRKEKNGRLVSKVGNKADPAVTKSQ